jgi:hypothetical protein
MKATIQVKVISALEEEIKENEDFFYLTEFDKSVQLAATNVQAHEKEKIQM